MPQLLKSFRPQLVNTSDISTVLFIQTFLTNPKTAIQDTVDQVKPNNLIIETIGGYLTTKKEKFEKSMESMNSCFTPNKKTVYEFNMVDYINNFSRYKREHSPLEYDDWLKENNIPMLSSSHHPISQDKTQKDHAVLIQEDSLLFSKQQLKQGADSILKYLNQSSPSAGVLSLPDGNNISITRHAERFFIFDPRGSLTQYAQQELLSFLSQQQHLTFAPLRPGPRLTLEPFHDRLFAPSSSSSFFKPPAPSAPPQQPVSCNLVNMAILFNKNNEYNDFIISKIIANIEGGKKIGLVTKTIILLEDQQQTALLPNLIKYLEQKGITANTISLFGRNKQDQIRLQLNKLNEELAQNNQQLIKVIYVGNQESDIKENFVGAIRRVNIPSVLAYSGLLFTATQPPLLKRLAHITEQGSIEATVGVSYAK